MVVTAVGTVGRGAGAAAGEGFAVTAVGAGGVLASMSRARVMKRTVGAGGVFLDASGSGVSESVEVGALGVAVSLRRFLDIDLL